jgi:putative transposase
VCKHPSRNSILTTRDNRAIILFVTVVANNRQCVLADGKVQSLILDMWRRVKGWIVGRYMIMPDHIHFFCVPTDYPPSDFHAWMACWKRMVSNRFPCPHVLPLWQRDCWDTQLRCGESYAAKWEYVRTNPVRKGLVDCPDSWPFQGELNVLAWHDR